MYRFNCADLKKNCLLVAGTESKYLFLENLKNGNSCIWLKLDFSGDRSQNLTIRLKCYNK